MMIGIMFWAICMRLWALPSSWFTFGRLSPMALSVVPGSRCSLLLPLVDQFQPASEFEMSHLVAVAWKSSPLSFGLATSLLIGWLLDHGDLNCFRQRELHLLGGQLLGFLKLAEDLVVSVQPFQPHLDVLSHQCFSLQGLLTQFLSDSLQEISSKAISCMLVR